MKVAKTMFAALLMAGLAVAQVAPTTPGQVRGQLAAPTPGADRPAPPPSQAVINTAPSRPAAGATASPARSGAAAASPFAAKKTSSKPSAKAAAKEKPSEAAAAAAPAGAKGRRDPFISPIVRASGGEIGGPPCTSGKRCLTADEMVLRGVVKSQSGMIAVVENSQHRTYFLRENDPVFSGSVVRITGDSMVIRENTTDSMGKPASRDVVKRVAPTA